MTALLRRPIGFLFRQLDVRPLAVFALHCLFGILVASRINIPTSVALVAMAIAALLGALLRRRRRARAVCLAMLFPLCLGALRFTLQEAFFPPVEPHFSVEFDGEILSDVTRTQKERLICTFHVTRIEGEPVSERVRLYARSDELPLEGLSYGQTLHCFGHIWPQEHATNPYEFDQANWLRGIGLQGMASAKLENIEIIRQSSGWKTPLYACRHFLASRIADLFPGSAALAQAFLLGDRSDLDPETRAAFNATGVAHLISLSGMHVTVLAAAVSLLLSRFLHRRHAELVTLDFIALYGALVGFPPSLCRAALMFAVMTGGTLCGRPSDPVTRICAALLAMLLWDPFYVFNTGFNLSFAASGGIILTHGNLDGLLGLDSMEAPRLRMSRAKRMRLRCIRYLLGLLSTSLAVTLATLPLVIATFGAQPLLAVPLNLLAIPLAMLAYPVSLAALMLSLLLPPMGPMLCALPDELYHLLVGLIQGASRLSVGVLRSPRYPPLLLLVHCVLLLCASSLSRVEVRKKRILAPALLLIVPMSLCWAWMHSLGFSAVFLDAGQADATVIKLDGHVYVYDTGEDYTPVDDYVSACCAGLDAVFLSHPHFDHAGGLSALLDALPPKVIYVPTGWFDVEMNEGIEAGVRKAQALGIPIVELKTGDRLQLSDRAYAVVYNPSGPVEEINDMSLLLEICAPEGSLLLSGDLTDAGAPQELPDVDVLRVAHHGAPNATDDRFLDATTPAYAIISVGENRYGHSDPDTLARLEACGARVYRTDECGAITVRLREGEEPSISTFLDPKGINP